MVTYKDGDRQTTCDPLQALGNIQYLAVPRYGAEGRLTGTFSADAALIDCRVGQGPDAGGPLRLSGTFDIATPAR